MTPCALPGGRCMQRSPDPDLNRLGVQASTAGYEIDSCHHPPLQGTTCLRLLSANTRHSNLVPTFTVSGPLLRSVYIEQPLNWGRVAFAQISQIMPATSDFIEYWDTMFPLAFAMGTVENLSTRRAW